MVRRVAVLAMLLGVTGCVAVEPCPRAGWVVTGAGVTASGIGWCAERWVCDTLAPVRRDSVRVLPSRADTAPARGGA